MTTSPYDNLPTGKSDRTKHMISSPDNNHNIPESEKNEVSEEKNALKGAYSPELKNQETVSTDQKSDTMSADNIKSLADIAPLEKTTRNIYDDTLSPNEPFYKTDSVNSSDNAQGQKTDYSTNPSVEKVYMPYEIKETNAQKNHSQENFSSIKSTPSSSDISEPSSSNDSGSAQMTSVKKSFTENKADRSPHEKSNGNNPHNIPFGQTLKYSKSTIKNRIGVREYTLPFDESQLVPDTMPDMKEILFTQGRASISQPSKTIYTKGDMLSGEIIFYTVYRPDQTSEPIDVVKSCIPFKTDKCWGENEDSTYRVSISLKSSASDLINERKFTAHGEICIKMTEITKTEINTLEGTDDKDFISLKSLVNASDLDFETEEISDISETLKVEEDQPSPAKILKEDINISETHRQITAGKLIINAVVNSKILYKGLEEGNTKICSASGKADFTQFIPLKTELDADLIKTEFDISGLEISVENDTGFLLKGQVRTKIQGYKNEILSSVSDAYHKTRDISFDVKEHELFSVYETLSGEISAREVINTDDITDSPQTLLCASTQSANISAYNENGKIIVKGELPVTILGIDSNDEAFTASVCVPLRGALDMQRSIYDNSPLDKSAIQHTVPELWFSIKDIWADTINSRQIEINATVSIEAWLTASDKFHTIENAVYIKENGSVTAKPFSMNIYVVGKNDTIWDIAKKYRSDEQTIARFNQIDISKPLPEGMKLFITQ